MAVSSGCSLLPKEEEEEIVPIVKPPQLSKKPEYVVKTDTLETKVRGSGKLMATVKKTCILPMRTAAASKMLP